MTVVDYSKFKIAKGFQHLDPKMWEASDLSSGFSSIRYRGKAWSLMTGGKQYPFIREDDKSPLTYLDVVFLGVNQYTSKTFFGTEQWTEDSTGGPICASLKGDVPDPGVPIPQNKSCGTCKHNEWGSKPGGGRACQDHKRAAVLLMPAMTRKMLSAPLLEPVFFKIPPGSFKTWKAYTDDMIHQGIPLAAMITRLAFSPPPKTFEITFEPIQALTEKEVPVVLPLLESRETKAIIGTTPVMRQVAPPAEKKPPERIETGLLDAFSPAPEGEDEDEPEMEIIPPKPVQKAAAKRRAKVVEAAPPEEAAVPPAENGEDYEESDTELDDSVRSLMGDKMNKMLP